MKLRAVGINGFEALKGYIEARVSLHRKTLENADNMEQVKYAQGAINEMNKLYQALVAEMGERSDQ